MKNILKTILVGAIVLSFSTSSVFAANANKGQKLFIKKLKEPCGFNGAVMANKHTQDQWEEINDAGKLGNEIKKQCPNSKPNQYKDRFLPHYYEFFHKFASDSGNVPSC